MKIAIMPRGRAPYWVTCEDVEPRPNVPGIEDIDLAVEKLKEVRKVLHRALKGEVSVSRAARDLGWINEDVQLAIWGEVRQ